MPTTMPMTTPVLILDAVDASVAGSAAAEKEPEPDAVVVAFTRVSDVGISTEGAAIGDDDGVVSGDGMDGDVSGGGASVDSVGGPPVPSACVVVSLGVSSNGDGEGTSGGDVLGASVDGLGVVVLTGGVSGVGDGGGGGASVVGGVLGVLGVGGTLGVGLGVSRGVTVGGVEGSSGGGVLGAGAGVVVVLGDSVVGSGDGFVEGDGSLFVGVVVVPDSGGELSLVCKCLCSTDVTWSSLWLAPDNTRACAASTSSSGQVMSCALDVEVTHTATTTSASASFIAYWRRQERGGERRERGT
uniref:RxLR effector candidate protein n=1 Tax=Hyaloperonospora arabidopsidis (strain Emoy2) TaxID=559515 RepID=M4BEI7_HYAAE